MKPYCKNGKPYIYAVFADHDKEQALSDMRKLDTEGITFWFTQQFSKKEITRIEAAYACLVFISNDSISDEKTRRSIEYAVKYNKKILCVYLDQVSLSPGLELRLNALQSIDRRNFTDDQAFFEKLKSAEIFADMQITPAQKRYAKRRALASVLLPITAAGAIFITIVYPLLIAPTVLAANGSMSKLGFGNLSLAELAEVEELRVVGHQTVDDDYGANYLGGEEEGEAVSGHLGIMHVGNISDITDLALLKNAKVIAFEANQISDITPLFGIKTLKTLSLGCNPIESIEGIQALQNLEVVGLEHTDISDITPLFQIPSLNDIYIRNTYVSSIEGIQSLTRLHSLFMGESNVTDISPLKDMDFSYIQYADGFSFDAEGLHIEDYSPLQNIPKFNYVSVSERGLDDILPYISNKQVHSIYARNCTLKNFRPLASIHGLYSLQMVNGTSLTTLDGIEELDSLVEIYLINCPNITDYTALLMLPRLERLYVTPDMIDRVLLQLEGASFRIINDDEG